MTSTHLLKLLLLDAEKKAEEYASKHWINQPEIQQIAAERGYLRGHESLHADICALVEALEQIRDIENTDWTDRIFAAKHVSREALQMFYEKYGGKE